MILRRENISLKCISDLIKCTNTHKILPILLSEIVRYHYNESDEIILDFLKLFLEFMNDIHSRSDFLVWTSLIVLWIEKRNSKNREKGFYYYSFSNGNSRKDKNRQNWMEIS